jgi:hypothetical protein
MTDESKKRPGTAFWATVTVAVILAYAVGLGPACWLSSRSETGAGLVSAIYHPVVQATSSGHCPIAIREGFRSYSELGAAPCWHWTIDLQRLDDRGPEMIFRWVRRGPAVIPI